MSDRPLPLRTPSHVPTKFPVNLNLPEARHEYFDPAPNPVPPPYRSSVRWKGLCCRNVQPLTGDPGDTIFILEVGHSIEFDWTWEGAVAFRPANPGSFAGDIDGTDDFVGVLGMEGTADGQPGVWGG